MLTVDTASLGFASDWFRPALMQRPHRHNEVEINFLECGSLTYLFGGARAQVRVGQIALFWATIPHQVVQVEEASILHWLTIPFATFLRWQLPDVLTQRVVRGNFMAGSIQDHGQLYQQQFRQWYDDLRQDTLELHKIVALEVEACLRRLALSSPTSLSLPTGSNTAAGAIASAPPSPPQGEQASAIALPSPSPVEPAGATTSTSSSSPQGEQERGGRAINAGGELSRVERIASFIAAHYSEPLSIARIAQEVHLHPNYAMSLFRKTFAISIVDYINQYRIAHAQRLLITSDLNISQIALEAGFGSVSRFYTAFKATCAQSPGDYRASLTLPQPLVPDK